MEHRMHGLVCIRAAFSNPKIPVEAIPVLDQNEEGLMLGLHEGGEPESFKDPKNVRNIHQRESFQQSGA